MSRKVSLGQPAVAWLTIFLLVASVVSLRAQNVLTTVAGTPWTFLADGLPARNAPLGTLPAVAADGKGNLYAADVSNNLVVRVSADGVLKIIAGNRFEGFAGDGGPATSAMLARPSGVTTDPSGNVYIADLQNNRVRKVGPNGVITTIAGGFNEGFAGDGGPATSASLSWPSGVALDSAGNLYIADTQNRRVRKVTPAGLISTVAGNGTAGSSGDGGPATSASLAWPVAVAISTAGDLYISEYDGRRIRKVNSQGIISTFAGGGNQDANEVPATSALLGQPYGLAFDAAGNLYFADHGFRRVYKVAVSGIITIVAGNGQDGFAGDGAAALQATFQSPSHIAVDGAGAIYVADAGNKRIRKVAGGIVTTVAGDGNFRFNGDNIPAGAAVWNVPMDVTTASDGTIYIVDAFNQRVRKVSASGLIATVAGTGVQESSADGGSAILASLNYPQSVAVDANGNVYLSDSRSGRVRRVSPTGTITTFAGPGSLEPNQAEGVPATSARLAEPQGLALDAAGNLYIADVYYHRIRRVSRDGIIRTVAGSGPGWTVEGGFSGDGGPATSAQLNTPVDVAVDSAGNLFIADFLNNRVRKVNASGIISTFAGNGVAGFSGDGGPAINASLNQPAGLALDASGNLYVADQQNTRIRRITPSGIISTVAGGGTSVVDVIGATAARLRLTECWPCMSGLAFDRDGNLLFAEAGAHKIRKLLAVPPTLSVSPTRLTFSVPAGGRSETPQEIIVTTSVPGMPWRSVVTTPSGGNWLAVTPPEAIGTTRVQVAVTAAPLTPGTYQATITMDSLLAGNPPQTVQVELTVTSAVAPQLFVEPDLLRFEMVTGQTSLPAQTLLVRNVGGGSLAWTAQVETASGGNWLSVSPTSGTATPSAGSPVQVSVNAASLPAGIHSGSIRFQSEGGAQPFRVTVRLLIAGATKTILLSRPALLYVGVASGAPIPAETVAILNTGEGDMNWTVTASTLSGGNWLELTPASGTSGPAGRQFTEVTVRVNSTGLAAGRYSGLVRVEATGANNSPQFVVVDLNLLPAGSKPPLLVRPTGLIFTASAGGAAPGSQTTRVATLAGSTSFSGGLLTYDGAEWLAALPRTATVAPGQPVTITLQPNTKPNNTALAAGIYRGVMTLLLDDGNVHNISVLLLVASAATGAASMLETDGLLPFNGACTPAKLVAVHRTLGGSFSSPAGWPAPIEVQVADDCGNAISNASVVASFSSGDAPLVLNSLRNGTYIGTWRPLKAATQVVVKVRATLQGLEAAEIQALGQVSGSAVAPLVYTGGIVNGASFAKNAALSPGSIVSVFGERMATGTNYAAPSFPLASTLGGATITIGGVEAPLFFSNDGQINAQIPFELTENSTPQAVLRMRPESASADALASPEPVTLASSSPGIFTTNQQGTGQGAILNTAGKLVDASAPAAAGEVVAVYCTGLGATSPAVASGAQAPSSEPLARTKVAVEAKVGGIAAKIWYAGLAPGFVGLYQVNVEIPAGVTPGSDVSLVLTQGSATSNTVTLAVR